MTAPQIKAVVFDLDGTLIDSVPDIASALNIALQAHGFTRLSDEAVTGMVGRGARMLVERAVAANATAAPEPAVIAAVHEDFLAAYARNPAAMAKLFPGASQAITLLRERGLALGICTNKPHPITMAVMDHLGLQDAFQCILGATAEIKLKPAPDMLLAVLERLNAEPKTAVMVGDSETDANAARAAGTRLILMDHGYSGGNLRARQAELGADVILSRFDQLPAAIEQLTAPATPR